MSADKSLGIFSRHMEAIVIVVISTVLKIGEHFFQSKLLHLVHFGNITPTFPSFSWNIFTHVSHLYQSHTSKNIGWIITRIIINWIIG